MIPQSPSADDYSSMSAKLQFRDLRRFMFQLQWSVSHTAALISAYAALVKLAPTEEAALELERMLTEEKRQYKLLEALYMELKGEEPSVQPERCTYTTHEEGLQHVIRLEREAIRQYRDTYLLTPSLRVRDLFFYGMSDSADHLVGLILMR
ncbi:ferritin-like domain-containing protein [Paenibacillus sp. OAS669]|uniref:ferritin-like domain-containing protein n=1 Tax=Paenibacillus sp. OAS669 TaxID=2663821 RepID=UPI00178A5F9C|nr:ferritin-like domain-containing protein [Paenibacillus sp. OAS669]MBE1447126.1 rubrerythrin [Paenibacillus sp. OAS669]